MAENRELALVLKLVADQFQSELKKSGGALSEFNKFVSDWKTQLVAAGGVLFAIAKSTANYGEELLKSSQKTGVAVSALSGLQYAAQLSNLTNEQLVLGLKALSVNMVEAARKTGDGEELFRRLGVAATTATGQLRPTEDVLLDLAEVFEKSKDGAGKAEAAVKLFGKAGLDLVPFLNNGKAGLHELMAEAEQLGIVLSQQDAEAANRFNDELKKLQATMRGFTLEAGKPLVGVLAELIEMFRSLTQSNAAQFFFKGLAEQAVLFTTLIKEAAANVEFLFGKLTFDNLKTEIARLEAEGQAKLMLLENPQAAQFVNGPAKKGLSAADNKPEIAAMVDQQKLGKALAEIFQEQYRAILIRNKVMQEGAAAEDAAYRHLLDFRDQEEQNDRDRQERLGTMIREQTSLEVKIREEALAKERDGLIGNAQAWVAYYDQLGGDTQNLYAHKTELLRAQLAKELDLTKAQSSELLAAWQDRDSARASAVLQLSPVPEIQKETSELNTLRQAVLNAREANGSFFEGWAEGMRRYVTQTGNGFNMATDMARSTAQAMESGFRTFFFDVMDNKVKSLKDVFRSLLGFVKQILAQVTAQLVTSQILRVAVAGFGGGSGASIAAARGAANPALFGPGFASGGSFTVGGSGGTDSTPISFMATPGEQVSVRTPGQQASPINIAITVNAGGGRRESNAGAAPNFTQLARQLSTLVELKLIEEQRPGGLLAGGTA